MTTQERRRRLTALGYRLVRYYRCPIRRCTFPYATLPTGTGSTCIHPTLASVDARIVEAEKMRALESSLPPIGS